MLRFIWQRGNPVITPKQPSLYTAIGNFRRFDKKHEGKKKVEVSCWRVCGPNRFAHRFTNWVPGKLVSEVEATASTESEKVDGLNGALSHYV